MYIPTHGKKKEKNDRRSGRIPRIYELEYKKNLWHNSFDDTSVHLGNMISNNLILYE